MSKVGITAASTIDRLPLDMYDPSRGGPPTGDPGSDYVDSSTYCAMHPVLVAFAVDGSHTVINPPLGSSTFDSAASLAPPLQTCVQSVPLQGHLSRSSNFYMFRCGESLGLGLP